MSNYPGPKKPNPSLYLTCYLVHQNTKGEALSDYHTLKIAKIASLQKMVQDCSSKLGNPQISPRLRRHELTQRQNENQDPRDNGHRGPRCHNRHERKTKNPLINYKGFSSPFPDKGEFSNLQKMDNSEEELPDMDSLCIRLSVLGNPGIGKSALALRYTRKDFVTFYEPTIEEE